MQAMKKTRTDSEHISMTSKPPSMTAGMGKRSSSPVARSRGDIDESADGTPKPADDKKTDKENITPVNEKDQGSRGTSWTIDDVSIVGFVALLRSCMISQIRFSSGQETQTTRRGKEEGPNERKYRNDGQQGLGKDCIQLRFRASGAQCKSVQRAPFFSGGFTNWKGSLVSTR